MSRPLRVLALAVSVAVSLSACDGMARTTMLHRSSIDGEYSIQLQTEILRDQATFRCVSSRTGECRVALYVRTCSVDVSVREGRIAKQCTVRSLASFAIGRGAARVVEALPPDFKLCVSPDTMPVVPACAMEGDGVRG